ncbi:hypothetical protein IE53DRAFT_383532 [Violaceomyces palustris]|uniref:Uncharacterized protein n=1 Tax=Violaceomyces palustris TaxID=1673888 RepID=A0ACD0P7B7_9BASI|nr:hypothetical protein IE53DRAFT_383532 [Violaceomyces palustris]
MSARTEGLPPASPPPINISKTQLPSSVRIELEQEGGSSLTITPNQPSRIASQIAPQPESTSLGARNGLLIESLAAIKASDHSTATSANLSPQESHRSADASSAFCAQPDHQGAAKLSKSQQDRETPITSPSRTLALEDDPRAEKSADGSASNPSDRQPETVESIQGKSSPTTDLANETNSQSHSSSKAAAVKASEPTLTSPDVPRSTNRTNTIPAPATSLSSRPILIPPPKASVASHPPPDTLATITPGSNWGPAAAAAAAARAENSEPGRLGELKRFTLWETKTRFYLVAYNTSQTRFRILKVDRTPPIAVTAPNQGANDRDKESNYSTSQTSTGHMTGGVAPSSASSHHQGNQGFSKDKEAGRNILTSELDHANMSSSSISASGQRYLSADAVEIPQLRKATDPSKGNLGLQLGNDGRDSGSGGPGQAGSGMAGGATSISIGISGEKMALPQSGASGAQPHSAGKGPSASSSAPNPRSKPTEAAQRDAEWELNVTSDRVVYTRTQVAELLEMIREGNRASGGLREVGRFFGIVGFIRFTGTYYMVLISRRSVVGLIGGHYIYHCDETKILPVCHPSVMAGLAGRTKAVEQEEARLLHLFKQVDMSKNFYFSYTYDLTKTLQDNLTSLECGSVSCTPGPSSHKPQAHGHGQSSHHKSTPSSSRAPPTTAWGYCEKFVWNHHLLLPAFGASEHQDSDEDPRTEWVLPLVYGFVDQAKLSVLNRTIYVTLIARRSRHFAGARFLKRGVDEKGHVANDVETEQIVSEALTTPFFAPARRRTFKVRKVKKSSRERCAGGEEGRGSEEMEGETRSSSDDSDAGSTFRYGASPRFTSYVMHRGSIPIYWTQDSTNMSPRPPIEISVVDPYYSAAALHFDDMFRRYGTPVLVLNLIKSKEKQPREVKLLRAFGECISYLNQFLPEGKKIKYIAWDMSRASKSHDQDVIGVLEDIAEEMVENTGFFHSGPEPSSSLADTFPNSDLFSKETPPSGEERAAPKRRETILLQSGVARVNCVDCLDRTNAAQFVIGKAAFGHQLHALGLLDHPSLPFDSDAVNMLTEMYHDLGDTIALQYGGSALAHTTDTYRKINQWTSHSRDVLESMKRYYANSFADADKQAAINLFLGVDPDAPDFSPSIFPELVEEEVVEKVVVRDEARSEEEEEDGDSDPRRSTKGDSEKDVKAWTSGKNGRKERVETVVRRKRRLVVPNRPDYRQWFTPEYLEPRASLRERTRRLLEVVNADAGFWAEYYRPSLFTDLLRHHAFKMTAVHQFQHQTGFGGHVNYGPGTAFAGGNGGGGFGSNGFGGHFRSGSNSSDGYVGGNSNLGGGGGGGGGGGRVMIDTSSPFKAKSGLGSSNHHQDGNGTPRRHARNHSGATNRNYAGGSPVKASFSGAMSPIEEKSSDSGGLGTRSSSQNPSRALLGGVKRWMSINRPPRTSLLRQGRNLSGGGGGGRRKSGMKTEEEGASNLMGGGVEGENTNSNGGWMTMGQLTDYQSFNFAGPWNHPHHPHQANANASSSNNSNHNNQTAAMLEQLVKRLTNPQVDQSEAAEYSFYTSQFVDSNRCLLIESHHRIDERDSRIYEESVHLCSNSSGLGSSAPSVEPNLGPPQPWSNSNSNEANNQTAASALPLYYTNYLNNFSTSSVIRSSNFIINKTSSSSFITNSFPSASNPSTGGGHHHHHHLLSPIIVNQSSNNNMVGSTNLDSKIRAYGNWLSMGTGGGRIAPL